MLLNMDNNKKKKYLTLTNIMAFLMIFLYILDRWIIPIPENYNGFKWEDMWKQSINTTYGNDYLNNLSSEELTALNMGGTIGGYKGGTITNLLGIIDNSINPNGDSFYRYFTVVFTHGFNLHLITNVIAFLIIGNYIEKKLGSLSMLGLFFATDILGVPITNMICNPEGTVITGASAGIFGLFGIGVVMCFLNSKNFKEFSKLKKIYLILYGIIPTYIISFGWTTIVHNISFFIGIILGMLLNIILPKFKEAVFNNAEMKSSKEEINA